MQARVCEVRLGGRNPLADRCRYSCPSHGDAGRPRGVVHGEWEGCYQFGKMIHLVVSADVIQLLGILRW